MSRFKAVFLDVGGTLLYMGDALEVYREILAEHGYLRELGVMRGALAAAREAAQAISAGPLSDWSIIAERERARRDRMVCELLAQLGVTTDFQACRQAIWASWVGTRIFLQFPEAESVLKALKERAYTLGAISNWEPRLEALCANQGLRQYLDFVLASEAEGHVKPSPYLFQKALLLAGVSPEAALHVGDKLEDDVEPARALGIAAVLLEREAAAPPTYSPTIRALDQLFPLLEADDWIQGCVVSGTAKAARFTELPWVHRQLQARFGFVPFPGTLNVRLSSEADKASLRRLKAGPGVPLEPEAGACAARCYAALLEGRQEAIVIVPEVAGYRADLLELVAPVRLRDALPLADGSPVTIVAR